MNIREFNPLPYIIPTYQLKFYRKCKSFQYNIVPITEIIIIDFFHKYDNELKKVQRPNIQKFILTYQNICTSILLNVTSVMLTANTLNQCQSPRPKWTFYKHVSDNSNKCLSVGNFGILFVVVVCSTSTAYTSLCRGLKHLR